MYVLTPRRAGLAGASLLAALVALFAALTDPAPTTRAQEPAHHVYLPGNLNRGHLNAGAAAPTAEAPTTVPASPTSPGDPGATATRTPEATLTPVTRPTHEGGHVGYPTGPNDVILQFGLSETDEPDSTFEEMNGTPWFTLYGDGTVIVGGGLMDREQPLYRVKVTADDVQVWLQELVYGVQLYRFAEDTYTHPGSFGKPVLHTYLYTTGGRAKRVMIGGFTTWERRAPDGHPMNPQIRDLLALVRSIEAWSLAGAGEPYAPLDYTLIVRWSNPPLLPSGQPEWRGINVRPIADAAPTAASNYVDRLPGHRFVRAAEGEGLRALVLPEWEVRWSIYSQAAEFRYGGRTYTIGVRKEVPGESLFLPDEKRAVWYRRDTGGGGLTGIVLGFASSTNRGLDPSERLWRPPATR